MYIQVDADNGTGGADTGVKTGERRIPSPSELLFVGPAKIEQAEVTAFAKINGPLEPEGRIFIIRP